MGNEAETEKTVRDALMEKGCYNNTFIIVEEKKGDIPQIDKLLETASKK